MRVFALASELPAFFALGVARLPKPRLASFLGILPLHAAAELLPADLLLPPLAAALADGPCCCGHAVRWRTLPDLRSDRFVPNPESGDDYFYRNLRTVSL